MDKKGETPMKKFKASNLVPKIAAIIFLDSEGILLVDYLLKETTMLPHNFNKAVTPLCILEK